MTRPGRAFRAVLLALAVASCAPHPGREAQFARGMEAYGREDYRRALGDLMPLADAGHAPSQYFVGRLYALGNDSVQQDFATAIAWYVRAAEQGYAEAQYSLGMLQKYGMGLPEDPVEAGTWLTRAAENGHAKAQYELAQMLQDGRGMPPNLVLAATWLIVAMNGLDDDDKRAATANLERLGELLSAEELDRARAIARAFRPGVPPR